MLSVITKGFQGASWNCLYQKCRSSPYFQLDKEEIFSQHELERKWDAKNNEKSEWEGLEDNVLLKEIPKKCYPKRSKAAACREFNIRSKT